MRREADPVATAEAIIDANLYMVLGTADEAACCSVNTSGGAA